MADATIPVLEILTGPPGPAGGAIGVLTGYVVVAHNTDSTDFTNTSTTTPADAVTVAVVLPAGTWTLYAFGGISAYHSASSSTWRCLVRVDGTDGNEASITPVVAGDRASMNATGAKAGVGGGATRTVAVRFYSSSAGTMTCDSSWVFVVALRTN